MHVGWYWSIADPIWNHIVRTVGQHCSNRNDCQCRGITFIGRCIHKIRTVSISFLASWCDGGANTCQRVFALRNHGQGGHRVVGSHGADFWRQRCMALVGGSCRRCNNVARWLARVARNGCQVGVGSQYGVATWAAYGVVRDWFPVCNVCRSCAPCGPRNI